MVPQPKATQSCQGSAEACCSPSILQTKRCNKNKNLLKKVLAIQIVLCIILLFLKKLFESYIFVHVLYIYQSWLMFCYPNKITKRNELGKFFPDATFCTNHLNWIWKPVLLEISPSPIHHLRILSVCHLRAEHKVLEFYTIIAELMVQKSSPKEPFAFNLVVNWDTYYLIGWLTVNGNITIGSNSMWQHIFWLHADDIWSSTKHNYWIAQL